ncbi:MAG: hypothetical protein IT329_17650, partial [Caldilineaceae bacterium]|nr:hypothetical protein [Caldilineaceae bacterium]
GYPLDGPRPDLGPITGSATFGGSIHLRSAQAPAAVTAGRYLYIATVWDKIGDNAAGPLATSLRLYAQDGTLVAQADAPLLDVTGAKPSAQSLALPVPGSTAPGPYALDLLVYRQADLTPLPAAPPSPAAPAFRLGAVEITAP